MKDRPSRSIGVLLTVDYTGLKIRQLDLVELPNEWRFVDAARWLRILQQVNPRPWFLGTYIQAVRLMADESAAARKRARESKPAPKDVYHELENLAWLAELRDALGEDWWMPIATHGSDMVLSLFRDEWGRNDAEVALEYFVQRWGPRRRLRVICLGTSSRIGWMYESVKLPTGFEPQQRRRGNYSTGTLGYRDLTDKPFEKAVRVGRRARRALTLPA